MPIEVGATTGVPPRAVVGVTLGATTTGVLPRVAALARARVGGAMGSAGPGEGGGGTSDTGSATPTGSGGAPTC